TSRRREVSMMSAESLNKLDVLQLRAIKLALCPTLRAEVPAHADAAGNRVALHGLLGLHDTPEWQHLRVAFVRRVAPALTAQADESAVGRDFVLHDNLLTVDVQSGARGFVVALEPLYRLVARQRRREPDCLKQRAVGGAAINVRPVGLRHPQDPP